MSNSTGEVTAPSSGIDRVAQLQLDMMKAAGAADRRGQHPKQHGCVCAEFKVLADIPDRYKVGLFAQPKTYKAFIRFSSGKEANDTKADIHGMAIKLIGVEGTKVLDAEASAETHDFILADHPVFFIRDTKEYVLFTEDLARITPTTPKEERLAKFFGWLKENRLADMPAVLGFVNGHVQDSPLTTQYWSQVPYEFGNGTGTICRYSATPHPGNFMVPPIALGERDADYLRRVMATLLAGAPARFDFNVQVRDGATPEVIDNPTVTWSTPIQRVAEITIRPQPFDSPEQMRFGENLSYTPWHALPDHSPVGQVNEIRKTVYVESSKLRHGSTGAPRTEPTESDYERFKPA
ncbi:MAG TPA: catalase family protein [Beijerinckiaceae bacterium]|jgi:catalase